jgi:hypothetical protein
MNATHAHHHSQRRRHPQTVPTLLRFISADSLVALYISRTGLAAFGSPGHARLDLPPSRLERADALQILDRHAAGHDAMILVAYSLDMAAADDALLYFFALRAEHDRGCHQRHT